MTKKIFVDYSKKYNFFKDNYNLSNLEEKQEIKNFEKEIENNSNYLIENKILKFVQYFGSDTPVVINFEKYNDYNKKMKALKELRYRREKMEEKNKEIENL